MSIFTDLGLLDCLTAASPVVSLKSVLCKLAAGSVLMAADRAIGALAGQPDLAAADDDAAHSCASSGVTAPSYLSVSGDGTLHRSSRPERTYLGVSATTTRTAQSHLCFTNEAEMKWLARK